jgi:hypothetical protein
VKRTIRVVPVFLEAVRLLLRLARDNPAVLLAPAALLVAVNYLEFQVLSAGAEFPSRMTTVGKVIGLEIAGAIILAVMAIAIHRLALLPRAENFLGLFAPVGRMVQYTVLVVVAVVLSNLVIAQLAFDAFGFSDSGAWPAPFAALPQVLSYALPFGILVLCACLLPAIAIDAPGASFNNSFLDTRFHLHRIAALAAMCFLPGFVIGVVLFAYFASGAEWPPDHWKMVMLKTVPKLVSASLLAAAASLCFRCYARRLLGTQSSPQGGEEDASTSS